MKRSLGLHALLAAAALALTAAPALAGTTEFGIGVFGGYNTYSMNDVNDLVAGSPIDEINGGIGFGGGLRVRTGPSLVLALDYERLNGSTDGSGVDAGITYDVDLDIPANAIIAGASYYFPSASKARFGLTGGVGYYMADGEISLSLDDGVNPPLTLVGDATGNSVGFHAGGALDYSLSPVAHFDLMAGYRVAKVSDLEDSDGNSIDLEAEYSGFMSRAGFSFYFGSH